MRRLRSNVDNIFCARSTQLNYSIFKGGGEKVTCHLLANIVFLQGEHNGACNHIVFLTMPNDRQEKDSLLNDLA